MNSKIAKKIRKAVRKNDEEFLYKFSASVKLMKFKERVRVAWKILRKKF